MDGRTSAIRAAAAAAGCISPGARALYFPHSQHTCRTQSGLNMQRHANPAPWPTPPALLESRRALQEAEQVKEDASVAHAQSTLQVGGASGHRRRHRQHRAAVLSRCLLTWACVATCRLLYLLISPAL